MGAACPNVRQHPAWSGCCVRDFVATFGLRAPNVRQHPAWSGCCVRDFVATFGLRAPNVRLMHASKKCKASPEGRGRKVCKRWSSLWTEPNSPLSTLLTMTLMTGSSFTSSTRLSPLSTPLMMTGSAHVSHLCQHSRITGSAHVSHLCQHSRITGSSFTSSTRLSPLSTLSHGKELHLHFKDTSLTSVNTLA